MSGEKDKYEIVSTELLQLQPYLKEYATSLTHDYDFANDLVQDTNIKVLLNFNKFEVGTNFKAWVSMMLRNTFINNYNKSSRCPIVRSTIDLDIVSTSDEGTSVESSSNIYIDHINSVKNSLPDYVKKFIDLRIDGLSYKEIAEIENIPVGTVKNKIFLARQELRNKLSDYAELI